MPNNPKSKQRKFLSNFRLQFSDVNLCQSLIVFIGTMTSIIMKCLWWNEPFSNILLTIALQSLPPPPPSPNLQALSNIITHPYICWVQTISDIFPISSNICIYGFRTKLRWSKRFIRYEYANTNAENVKIPFDVDIDIDFIRSVDFSFIFLSCSMFTFLLPFLVINICRKSGKFV